MSTLYIQKLSLSLYYTNDESEIQMYIYVILLVKQYGIN